MSTGSADDGSPILLVLSAVGVSFVVYFLTLTQSVGWNDSPELALAAWQMGASHAPGSPLHAVLGRLMMVFFEEPYRGVTLLSALCTSISVGVLALLASALKRSNLIALCAALIYAFSYQVWASAVMTEIYSLSICFLSIALLNAWYWRISSKRRNFVLLVLAYALSLAAYFANILLAPAFAYLIYRVSSRKAVDLLSFSVAIGLTILIIGFANYLLAKNVLPYGEVAPDSIVNMFLYMSGSQHAPLNFRDMTFVLTRLIEHLSIFSRSLLFLGIPLGLLGGFSLARIDKVTAHFLLLIFVIYMAYYTIFGPGDYFMMVLPAYFVFCIWIALGALWLIDRARNPRWEWLPRLVPVCVIAGLVLVQFDARRLMARSFEAESFATATFEFLPSGSLAIAGRKEFPTLRYFQDVHGRRQDVRFILPARSVRRYPHGEVSDYVAFVGDAICSVPVFTLKDLPDLGDQYQLQYDDADSPWMRVTGASGALPQFCQ
jgi:hypothetical protein